MLNIHSYQLDYLKKLSDKELKNITSGKWTKPGRLMNWDGNLVVSLGFSIPNSKKYYYLFTDYSISIDIRNLTPITYEELLPYIKPFNSQKLSTVNALQKITGNTWKKLVIKKCTEIFPDNVVEDNLMYQQFTITCRLGDVEITNSLGLIHLLRGLFIRFTFEYSSKSLVDFQFLRTEVTYAENSSGYLFSHSSSTELGKWRSSFCFGATLLNTLKNRFHKGTLTDLYDLHQFFILINDYFRWESLEGRPYKYISDIKIQNNTARNPIPYNTVQMFQLPLSEIIPNLSYSITPGDNSTITLTPESISYIDSKLSEAFPQYCYPHVNNMSYNNLNNIEERTVGSFSYKGEIIPCKILSLSDSEIDYRNVGIHRDILTEIVHKLNEELTTQFNRLKWEQLLQA